MCVTERRDRPERSLNDRGPPDRSQNGLEVLLYLRREAEQPHNLADAPLTALPPRDLYLVADVPVRHSIALRRSLANRGVLVSLCGFCLPGRSGTAYTTLSVHFESFRTGCGCCRSRMSLGPPGDREVDFRLGPLGSASSIIAPGTHRAPTSDGCRHRSATLPSSRDASLRLLWTATSSIWPRVFRAVTPAHTPSLPMGRGLSIQASGWHSAVLVISLQPPRSCQLPVLTRTLQTLAFSSLPPSLSHNSSFRP